MSKNKVIHLPIIEQAEVQENSNISERPEVISLVEKRNTKLDEHVKEEFHMLPLSSYNEQTRNLLREIADGNLLNSNPKRTRINEFIGLHRTPVQDFVKDLMDDDPLHDKADYLDELLQAIAPEIGKEVVLKIADAMLDVLGESYEYGRFTQLNEDLT